MRWICVRGCALEWVETGWYDNTKKRKCEPRRRCLAHHVFVCEVKAEGWKSEMRNRVNGNAILRNIQVEYSCV